MNVVFHRFLLDDYPDPIVMTSASGDSVFRRNGAKHASGFCSVPVATFGPIDAIITWDRLVDRGNEKSEGNR